MPMCDIVTFASRRHQMGHPPSLHPYITMIGTWYVYIYSIGSNVVKPL